MLDGNPTINELCDNVHRVIKKINRELEPGNNRDSKLIDLINHLETLMQEIESANK